MYRHQRVPFREIGFQPFVHDDLKYDLCLLNRADAEPSGAVLFAGRLTPRDQAANFAELDRLARLPQVVLLLERHPSFGAGVKSPSEPERHSGTHSSAAIEQLGKRFTGNPERLGSLRNRQLERLQAKLTNHLTWMGGIVHDHNHHSFGAISFDSGAPFLMIIQIINVADVTSLETKNDAPVAGHRN
jgi:hypothetical protein